MSISEMRSKIEKSMRIGNVIFNFGNTKISNMSSANDNEKSRKIISIFSIIINTNIYSSFSDSARNFSSLSLTTALNIS